MNPITAFTRDPDTLGRQWVAPGTPGLVYRVGGIEKDAVTGNISYDPDNHEQMVKLRAEKIARVAERNDRAMIHEGPDSGELLAIGWGSTFGPVRQAVRNLQTAGHSVAHLHLRQLSPLPSGLEAILKRYKKIVCAEMNSGQLANMLRAKYLLPVEPVTQISGRPFLVHTLEAEFSARLKGRMS